jgi:hypothetical protein
MVKSLRLGLRTFILLATADSLGAGGAVFPMNDSLEDVQDAQLTVELHRLKTEHRDLDAAIAALEGIGPADQLQIQRLKKRKLFIKDRIIQLEDQLTPDIIA